VTFLVLEFFSDVTFPCLLVSSTIFGSFGSTLPLKAPSPLLFFCLSGGRCLITCSWSSFVFFLVLVNLLVSLFPCFLLSPHTRRVPPWVGFGMVFRLHGSFLWGDTSSPWPPFSRFHEGKKVAPPLSGPGVLDFSTNFSRRVPPYVSRSYRFGPSSFSLSTPTVFPDLPPNPWFPGSNSCLGLKIFLCLASVSRSFFCGSPPFGP